MAITALHGPRGRWQDNARRCLRRASSRRLSRNLVDKGANGSDRARDLAALGVRLGWVAADEKGRARADGGSRAAAG